MKINVTNGKQPINLLVEAGTYEKKYKTAEGNPVILTDAWSNYPLKSLGVNMNPIQDLHGYDHPWVGGGGKNLFSVEMEHTASNVTYAYIIKGLTPNAQYTLSTDIPQTSPASLYFNGGDTANDGTYINHPQTRTANEDGELTIYVRYAPVETGGINAYQAYLDGTNWVQLELGTTATAYEPYENVCPISGWNSVNVYKSGKNVYSGESQIIIDKHIARGTTIYIQIFDGTFMGSTLYAKTTTADWVGIGAITRTKNPITINRDDILQIKLSSSAYSDLNSGGSKLMVSFMDFDSYEPYQGQTITKDLGQTRYGCKVDIVSGVLTVDKVMVDLGSLNWSSQSTSNQESYYSDVIDDVKKPSSTTALSGAICSAYSETIAESFITRDNGVFCVSQSGRINVNDNAYSDVASFKTAMSGVQLVYELAEPQTIQLTPEEVKTLMKETILMTNADSLLVEYRTNER